MSYFIQNLRRFAREIGKEKPSRIPARLAAAARSKITVVGEAVLDRTGTGRLFGTRYRGQGVGLMADARPVRQVVSGMLEDCAWAIERVNGLIGE